MHKQTIGNKFSGMVHDKKVLQIALFAFFLFILLISVAVYAIEPKRQAIKVVYFKSLSSYITWPKTAGLVQAMTFELCIIGKDSLNDYLHQAYYNTNRPIKKKPVRIRQLNRIDEVAGCHLLFIGESESRNVSEILAFIKGKPILTVGETRGFLEKNGMIQFYMTGQKVKVKLSYPAVIDEGFIMNPGLSSVIKVIR